MHSDLELNGKLGAEHMLENLFEYCLAKESRMNGRPKEQSNFIKDYVVDLLGLCFDDVNTFCRERLYNLRWIHEWNEDNRNLWNDASLCVNKTFSSRDPSKVDYFKDENPVLQKM